MTEVQKSTKVGPGTAAKAHRGAIDMAGDLRAFSGGDLDRLPQAAAALKDRYGADSNLVALAAGQLLLEEEHPELAAHTEYVAPA